MKTIPLIIFSFLILIIGCDSTNEPILNSQDYFPLKIGNKWYYNITFPIRRDTTSINLIYEVKGKEEIDNKSYFKIIETYLQSNFVDTIFYRFGGDTLFLKRIDNSEQIIADFSLSLNDTAYWQDDLKVVAKTNDLITFEVPIRPDYGYSITFQRGIGITNEEESGIAYYNKKLIKAEIK